MSTDVYNLGEYPLAEDESFVIRAPSGALISINGKDCGNSAVVRNGDAVRVVYRNSSRTAIIKICNPLHVVATTTEPIKPKKKPFVDYRKPYWQRNNPY